MQTRFDTLVNEQLSMLGGLQPSTFRKQNIEDLTPEERLKTDHMVGNIQLKAKDNIPLTQEEKQLMDQYQKYNAKQKIVSQITTDKMKRINSQPLPKPTL